MVSHRASGPYFTPYRSAEMKDNCLSTEDKDIEYGVETYRGNEWQVDSGYIHTFRSFLDAYDEAFRIYTPYVVIFECTIPKGTLYYEGKYGPDNSLASRKIIFNRIEKTVKHHTEPKIMFV